MAFGPFALWLLCTVQEASKDEGEILLGSRCVALYHLISFYALQRKVLHVGIKFSVSNFIARKVSRFEFLNCTNEEEEEEGRSR